MGQRIELRAADGFELGAWESTPSGTPKGAVVVIQEIFGVNNHIREVVDGYAEVGYAAVAPQIFDRTAPNVELGYEEADMGRGIELAFQKLQMPNTLADIQAAIDHASAHGRVGVVGYCFGGLLTWLSACELNGVAAASSYYGGGVAGEAGRSPKCPVIMHFGELDAHIPLSDVDKVKAAQPDVPVYVYAADHGFNCDHRASYDAPSADLARQRTLAFFQEHLG
ncbi:MAG: dienelactone hydrolase family protein [Gammaproteobacteria bacterium]|nr:dienelactone hydrolase family protein [Gammaproteobacteria bacterium]